MISLSAIYSSIRALCLFGLALLSACGRSPSDLEVLHSVRGEGLEQIADQFLADSSLRNLGVAPAWDPSLCEWVNTWRRCSRSGAWEDWDMVHTRKVFLPSLFAVLKHEKIAVDTYDQYAHLLRTSNLSGIEKGLESVNCVDFTSGLNGLRYCRDTSYQLDPDHEYLYVKRLSPHWHVYTRDWN